MKEPVFKVKEETSTPDYGKFVIEPLETGFGHTVGNALRRVLLTSIPGAAVTHVKINGVKHRFSTVPGLKENIIDFLLNIKGLSFRLLDSKPSATVTLSARGPLKITAKELDLPSEVEIINPNHYLGSLAAKEAKLEVELTIERGYGYSLSEDRKVNTLGVIPADAVFTPVTRVNYTVEETRVGRQTNLDKLNLEVWTNGSVSPKEALDEAAKILTSYFLQIHEPTEQASNTGMAISQSVSEDVLKLTVDELDLPTRIYNSLRNGGIETLGQLLTTPKKDLMSMRNMGGKSISIIEEKLREKGVSLSV